LPLGISKHSPGHYYTAYKPIKCSPKHYQVKSPFSFSHTSKPFSDHFQGSKNLSFSSLASLAQHSSLSFPIISHSP
jgi:hypothetical protein